MTGVPDKTSFRKIYDHFLASREFIVRELERTIDASLTTLAAHPFVKVRVKDFDSYFKKYIKLRRQNPAAEPLITDIIGVRIVCPFLEDLAATEELLKAHFNVTEVDHKGGDHTFREFGYESIHLLISIPPEIAAQAGPSGCAVAEVQIRTILQDAWAEVEHELVYKAEFTPFDAPMKRKLAAVNASLHLADIIFQEIRTYQRQLNGELSKRRESFFQKIERSTDLFLTGEAAPAAPSAAAPPDAAAPERPPLPSPPPPPRSLPLTGQPLLGTKAPGAAAAPGEPGEPGEKNSIDELLLDALEAHNHSLFPEAIDAYTRILALAPAPAITALIYKHRGMAHFACSRYNDALDDFSRSLELDPASYKAAYYHGIVSAVTEDYAGALDAFNTSLGINPYQPYCLYRRAQAYYHLEDYPQALADCDAALALEPLEAVARFRRLVMAKLKM